ncbi:MAG: polysaccharide deacetylase family protein, partial [bacterium]|nr:polysaccharide deacetylase family protein [bacterium]
MLAATPLSLLAARRTIPERTVVLTFDDSVKSHLSVAAPLLKDLGFGASFFVTHRWMADKEHFLDWDEIARLHEMGFEIGNHTWDHRIVSTPRGAARLAGQLALVENALAKVDVPRPVSFAWPANRFGPEAFGVLREAGFKLARRGSMPEGDDGPLLDPSRHHPLLIPSTGIARPDWTADRFRKVIDRSRAGRAVVLQFHGVPDEAHPWVHTPQEMFEQYMRILKDGGYRVLALRDLGPYLDPENPPDDPLRTERHRAPKGELPLPVEVEASQSEPHYWLSNMRRHGYSAAEASLVLPGADIRGTQALTTRVLPYPGGRHPRIGFLDGCIDPLRGTKASVFLPWDPASYVVVDLPEAIFSNLGLMFLGHTHVPSIWDNQNILIENTDWVREPDGGLRSTWRLPNEVSFGAAINPTADGASM